MLADRHLKTLGVVPESGRAESAPEIKCDVVFVDGAKGTAARANDLNLFRAISKPGAMVFGDEIDTVSCASGQDNPTGCTTFGRTATCA